MTRNRSGCWTQDPARIFYNMCFIRKARRINETILVSSPPPNADRTTDLSTNGFIQVMILARVQGSGAFAASNGRTTWVLSFV